MTPPILRLLARFKSFWTATGGNVAIIFALSTIPVVGLVGVAVDYSQINSTRTAMQMALDSTALMLSKDAQFLTTDQLQQKTSDYFNALFQRPEAKNLKITSAISSPQQGNFVLAVASTATVDATLSRVIGEQEARISASTEVKWGIKKIELALALDNTGSMASNGKMDALKTAAHNLINTLKDASKTPGDVKISIIPFDTTVNIGTAAKNEFWIDYSWPINSSNWEGCVKDRNQSFDVLDTTPVSSNSNTYYPVADCGSLTQAMPLSYDWTALHNKVDAMSASGKTNVTIGLVWAWHALTSNLPYTQAAAPSPDLDKVIILLTDGDNTQNRWTTSETLINARTQLVCANAKAANIKIYTIRVINGNTSLLKACATNPTMYYDVQQASQLSGVFSSIAQNLANLRISK